MDSDAYFDNADEAVGYCQELIRAGKADLFRGQTNDWPTIAPSLFRGTASVREAARTILAEFMEWATIVPQMALYRHSPGQITAIAQHYRIPTQLLDLTTDPEIAELFSRATSDDDLPGEAVTYCFKRRTIESSGALRLVELDVANLWRLQAQRGLFLEYIDESAVDAVRHSAIRVHFPRSSLEAVESARIYPLRKSALEIVIDQWIYRNQVAQIFTSLSGIKVQTLIRRYTYPGMFRWRSVPEFSGDWIENHPGWIFPIPEHVDSIVQSKMVPIALHDARDVRDAYSNLEEQFRPPLEEYAQRGASIEFAVAIESFEADAANASVVLNRCWDGIRVHPYSVESAIRCMAATALALIRRVILPDATDSWEEELWGELELIDTAPVGGHLDAGGVSKAAFRAAVHSKYNDGLIAYAKRKVADDPLFIMDYVVDPWIIFDFEKLSTMFVEQFIPSCISGYWDDSLTSNEGVPGELWGISFNTALLAFVTRFGFRFHSPIATERDVERVILISADMDESDIEEIFVSCLPAILAGDAPYTVKFTDYSREERGVWEIERAVEQCKMILRVGGISVLDVIPGARDLDSDEPVGEAGGLGAFNIWAIANDRFAEVNGIEFGKIRHIFDEFWGDLGQSNVNLEARARAQPDWPAD